MRRFGLIGYPLDHSFSKDYFTKKFKREGINAVYDNFPLKTIDEFKNLIALHPDLNGLNVTSPHKSAITAFLDGLDAKAESTGAVNVISIKGTEPVLKGYNTDIDGFVLSLKPMIDDSTRKALVMGTGGASMAVRAGLDMLGIDYSVVSRHRAKTGLVYQDITGEMIKDYQLIINASPLGTFPNTGSAPDIPYHSLKKGTILYDLVYNPGETLFLRQGKAKGCRIKNGMEMLIIQAGKAWDIWNS